MKSDEVGKTKPVEMLEPSLDVVPRDAAHLVLGPNAPLIVLSLVFFVFGLIWYTDPDYWWHLRTGRLIVQNLAIPHTDPFSYTAAGKHWVAHEWLSEVLIYALQRLAGYWADVLLFTSVALASLLVAHYTALSFGLSRRMGLLLFLWAAMMTIPAWTVRPQVFTWLLFAVFLKVLADEWTYGQADKRPNNSSLPVDRASPVAKNSRRLWVLPGLMVLWVNLHLGFAFGLGLVGLYALTTSLEYSSITKDETYTAGPLHVALRGQAILYSALGSLRFPQVSRAWFCFGGCLAATLLTPNPGEMLLYPLVYLTPSSGVSVVTEWQSPSFHGVLNLPLAAAILTLIAFGVGQVGRGQWRHSIRTGEQGGIIEIPRLFLPAVALVFTFLALNATRNVPLFAVVFVVVAGMILADQGQTARRERRVRTKGALNAVLVAGFLVCMSVALARSSWGQLHEEPETSGIVKYPVAGAAVIRDRYPEARIFNDYTWGGYLINALYPQKVFIDGRSEFYGAVLDDYLKVAQVKEGWAEVLDQYSVQIVLVPKSAPVARLLDASNDRWELVFTGPVEALYARRTPH